MRGLEIECGGTTMYCGTYVHATRGGAAGPAPAGPARLRAYSLRRYVPGAGPPRRPTTHTPLQLHEQPGIGPRRQSSSGHADALCGCHSRKAAAPCRSPGRKASSYRRAGTCSFLHIPWRCPFDWLKASSSPPLPMTTTAGTPARRTVQPPSHARALARGREGALYARRCARCARACAAAAHAKLARLCIAVCSLPAPLPTRAREPSASRSTTRQSREISGTLRLAHRPHTVPPLQLSCEAARQREEIRTAAVSGPRRRSDAREGVRRLRGAGRARRKRIVQGRVSRKGLACVSEVSRKCRKVSECGAPVSPVEGEPVALLRLKVSLTERGQGDRGVRRRRRRPGCSRSAHLRVVLAHVG